jgi:hypothetical protein
MKPLQETAFSTRGHRSRNPVEESSHPHLPHDQGFAGRRSPAESALGPRTRPQAVGMFDPELNPLAWFDKDILIERWFDPDLIPAPTQLVHALLSVFTVVRPDHAHAEHHRDDLVAIATTDFLALSVIAVAALPRLRLARYSRHENAEAARGALQAYCRVAASPVVLANCEVASDRRASY